MKKLNELKAGQFFMFVGKNKGLYKCEFRHTENIGFSKMEILNNGLTKPIGGIIERNIKSKYWNVCILDVQVKKQSNTNFHQLDEETYTDNLQKLECALKLINNQISPTEYLKMMELFSTTFRMIGRMSYFITENN